MALKIMIGRQNVPGWLQFRQAHKVGQDFRAWISDLGSPRTPIYSKRRHRRQICYSQAHGQKWYQKSTEITPKLKGVEHVISSPENRAWCRLQHRQRENDHKPRFHFPSRAKARSRTYMKEKKGLQKPQVTQFVSASVKPVGRRVCYYSHCVPPRDLILTRVRPCARICCKNTLDPHSQACTK